MLALNHGAARDHHVVAFAIQLDQLELEFLALEVDRITHRTHVDQRTRQECADVLDVDGEAALDLAADATGDDVALLERFFQFVPHHGALGFLARQDGFTEAILDGVQRHFHLVADADVDFARIVPELFDRHDAFGLQACVDHHDIVADIHNGADDDRARLQLGQMLLALFKQFGK